jgi:type IV pilus assembly protein PilA
MALRPRSQAGFTLIELMIVVAILGILAALVVPNFIRFQLRAKSSEGKSNLAAIRTAELGYFAEHRAFVAAATTPAALSASGRQPWPTPVPACANCFDQLGFEPSGEVSFQYEVVAAVAGGSAAGPDVFTAAAVADLDGDGVTQIWGYVRPLDDQSGSVPSTLTGGAAATPCLATGTWDAVAGTAQQLESVGPCDASSGQNVF